MIVQHKGALYSNAVQFSSELQLSETLSPNATLFTLSKEDPLFALFALSSPIHLLCRSFASLTDLSGSLLSLLQAQ